MSFAAVSICLITANAHAANTYYNLNSGLIYERNMSHGLRQVDKENDAAVEAELTASRSMRLSNRSGLVLYAGGLIRQQAKFTDLSLLRLKTGLRYRIQPVVGFTNPWIELALDTSRLEYRDSEIRDGWSGTAGVSVGKYFTDRISMSLAWQYESRYADNTEVYEYERNSFSLTADYQFPNKSHLYTRATRIYGDQISTVKLPSNFAIYGANSKTFERDHAYENGSPNESRAYRIGAISNVLEVGFNYPVQNNLALDFSLQHYKANTDGGNSYESVSALIAALYQF